MLSMAALFQVRLFVVLPSVICVTCWMVRRAGSIGLLIVPSEPSNFFRRYCQSRKAQR